MAKPPSCLQTNKFGRVNKVTYVFATSLDNIFGLLKGNVAHDDDVEQRPNRPHGGGLGAVLGFGIGFGREEFGRPTRHGVDFVRLEVGGATKVNQLHLQCVGVDQDVLVFDVPVEDSALAQLFADLHQLQ